MQQALHHRPHNRRAGHLIPTDPGALPADPRTKEDIVKRRIEFSPKSSQQIATLIETGFKAATPTVVKEIRAIYKK